MRKKKIGMALLTAIKNRQIDKRRQLWHWSFRTWQTRRRDGRQGKMAETMVISRRSVKRPHNLPASLESEDDERERKGQRAKSRRAKVERKRATGRQKCTNVNEFIRN